MTPLQPGEDHAADRDQGASAERDDDEGSGLPLSAAVHADILQHIADCLPCRRTIFVMVLKSLAEADAPRWTYDFPHATGQLVP